MSSKLEQKFCRYCGRAFLGSKLAAYCGECLPRRVAARRVYYDKIMSDPVLHEAKLEANRKWREWAKVNDPEYRRRKAESQRIWRMKKMGVWMR